MVSQSLPLSVTIRAVHLSDAGDWEQMRHVLWPADKREHAADIARFFAGDRREPAEVLVAVKDGRLVGFAELSIRPSAVGCQFRPVAYLEGWFVTPSERRQGIGAALIRAAEAWGRAQDCQELGSDALIENTVSIAAQKALGFIETERLVCFRKLL